MNELGRFAQSRRPDGTPVLTVTGEIDMSNAAAFATALTTALDGADTVVVDLTGLEYLDSAGLTTLLLHASRIEVIAPARLSFLLTVSGLAQVTTVHLTD